MKKILLIILLLAGVSFSQVDTVKVPGSRYNSADSIKIALDRGFTSVQTSDSATGYVTVNDFTVGLATKQNAMGSNDNYVTDAEKIVIGNTSNVNSGDNAVNTLYSNLPDSDAVKAIALAEATTKLDTMASGSSTYTINEVDSILTLAQTVINALRGGATGQVLVKNSNTDFDYTWADVVSGGITDNTSPNPPTGFVAIGGTNTDQFTSNWDETASLSGGDLNHIRFYAGASNDSTALVLIDSVNAGTTTYDYRSLSAGTTYWAAVKAVDDSGNVSYFSNIDSATTLSASGGYLAGANYVWNHLTETNNAVLTSWDDTTSALSIYSNGDPANTPYNLDSGVVWTAYDQYLRQAASFPAGLFDSALTIEMVVKVIRTDSSQCLFQARNASNIAMGIGIGATGIFVGNAYDATGGEDYTHNSTATTGWHHLVYTWNGTTTTAFYVDGNLVSDTGDLNQYDAISGDNRISMGKTGATNFPICAGTLTPYIAVYKRTLTAQQVSDNFNSTVIQNQIPAWAR